MKGIVLLAIGLGSMIAATSCRKESRLPPGTVIHSGRVVKDMCGNVAVQLTDGTRFGQMGWTDGADSWDHIFRVANPCTWGRVNSDVDIRFRFVPETEQQCAVCAIFVPLPDTAYSIQVLY